MWGFVMGRGISAVRICGLLTKHPVSTNTVTTAIDTEVIFADISANAVTVHANVITVFADLVAMDQVAIPIDIEKRCQWSHHFRLTALPTKVVT